MKMKKVAGLVLGSLLVLSSLAGCSASNGTKASSGTGTKFKIAFSTWVGYGPLYIAKEKGFFSKYGIDPQLTPMQDEAQFAPSMSSNSIQAVAHVLDREVINYANGLDEKVSIAMDQSLGGDGIIASKDIKTVADLKGKTIGLDKSSTSYFFFLTILSKNGLKESDVTVKDMAAADAGAAFVSGKLDAAVTWEPWLTNSSQRDGGHTLVSSKDYPNTIVDVITFNQQFIKSNPDAVKGMAKAWYDAVAYYKQNPKDGAKIMAKGLGISQSDFDSEVKGVQYYGKAENQKFFDKSTTDNIFSVTDRAVGFWVDKGLIKKSFEASDLISTDYVNAK